VSDKSIHLESSLSCPNEFSLFVCVCVCGNERTHDLIAVEFARWRWMSFVWNSNEMECNVTCRELYTLTRWHILSSHNHPDAHTPPIRW
jgi:hypothetical protein